MEPTPTTTPDTAAPQLPKNPYVKFMALSLLTLFILFLLLIAISWIEAFNNNWVGIIFFTIGSLAFFPLPILIFLSTRFMLKNENPRGKYDTLLATLLFLLIGVAIIICARMAKGVTAYQRERSLRSLQFFTEDYLEDHDTYPAADQWCDALIEPENIAHKDVWQDKYLTNYLADELKLEHPCHFAMNNALANKHPSDIPDHTVMFFEAAGPMNLHGDETFFHSQHDLFPQRYLILIDGTVIVYHPDQQEYNFFPLYQHDTPCPTPIWQPN